MPEDLMRGKLHADSPVKAGPGTGHSRCKGPEAAPCLTCLRNSRAATVAGAEEGGGGGEEMGEEVRKARGEIPCDFSSSSERKMGRFEQRKDMIWLSFKRDPAGCCVE